MTALVSIIVPIFNREHYVEQLISTVKRQTYPYWELLLIDDGSTDKTVALLQKHLELDSRIKCFSNSHIKGASGARNTGLELANGKYVAYQDSDDEWIEDHLKIMVYYLEKYPEKINLMSANPLRKYRESGEVFNYDQIELEKYSFEKVEDAFVFSQEKAFDYQLRGRIITTQCIVAQREIIKNIRWDESLKAATDNLYNLRLSAQQLKIGHIQNYHAIYWAHDDNITNCGGNHDAPRMERVQSNFIKYWRIILKDFSLTVEQKRYVKKNLSETLAWHYAYAALEPQEKYVESISVYWSAFLIWPSNIGAFNSALKCTYKACLSKFK
ncbi:glycosyltransferase family 2 protein [Alteromonas sp. 1_MG-2023]|uniref:glycosyltransferase family 2 protein n=1 Tax=Alteromonas sp. 1_MG-2023 TaxID=3062669 RepID=UPI0026E14EDD|nr:glycosyltransferase family 2 protein [Alteromonas sp. 1_MG-2023]MDO6566324.1 glycosyltransferase family 2 protein [Alteromonas sp. 1_MG-2023]